MVNFHDHTEHQRAGLGQVAKSETPTESLSKTFQNCFLSNVFCPMFSVQDIPHAHIWFCQEIMLQSHDDSSSAGDAVEEA